MAALTSQRGHAKKAGVEVVKKVVFRPSSTQGYKLSTKNMRAVISNLAGLIRLVLASRCTQYCPSDRDQAQTLRLRRIATSTTRLQEESPYDEPNGLGSWWRQDVFLGSPHQDRFLGFN